MPARQEKAQADKHNHLRQGVQTAARASQEIMALCVYLMMTMSRPKKDSNLTRLSPHNLNGVQWQLFKENDIVVFAQINTYV